MPCTTMIVGKNASFNQSTMIARNDDSCSGEFTAKQYTVVLPNEQPVHYHSVISHLNIELPNNPMTYTAMPNPDPSKEGIWAAAGINEENVAMTATETITSNVRVLSADPYVEYEPAYNGNPAKPGGIGEEDIVVLVLPYIHSAREGVLRLGELLEKYGTYEANGIAFSDQKEVWYMETIGGHHWIARKLPDDCYAVIANQFSLDVFDLEDALGTRSTHMASKDLREFIEENHLDLNQGNGFNARLAFGSHDEADHVYNTPRVWYGQRMMNPDACVYEPDKDFYPESDSIPWCRKPQYKITVSDVKSVLSSCYEGTPYNPYGSDKNAGLYRPIGINRTSCTACLEIRNNVVSSLAGVEWLAFGSNAYNAFVPQYTRIKRVPDYFLNTSQRVTSENFYWVNRIISAMADPDHIECKVSHERYELAVGTKSRQIIKEFESSLNGQTPSYEDLQTVNDQIAEMTRKETEKYLAAVLYQTSMKMKNSFARSDH